MLSSKSYLKFVNWDLTFPFTFSNVEPLGKFVNLKTLILDHNNVANLRTFPAFAKLETLSLAYNTMRDLDSSLIIISRSYPMLKHLNLIKNPVNPMFAGQAAKYDTFRATFKIWVPSLMTLDGIDFKKDEAEIANIRTQVEQAK